MDAAAGVHLVTPVAFKALIERWHKHAVHVDEWLEAFLVLNRVWYGPRPPSRKIRGTMSWNPLRLA